MGRSRSAAPLAGGVLARLDRHFANCGAVIAGTVVLVTAAAPAQAAVIYNSTPLAVTTTSTTLPDPQTGGGYYKPGGIYIDFVDGTTASTGSAPPTSGSQTTGAPSWNVHLFSSTYNGYYGHRDTSYAETAQSFAANGSANGQYADIVNNGSTAALLTAGAVVGPTSTYNSTRRGIVDTKSGTSADTSNWQPGSSGYLGVEFLDSSGLTHYGWVAMSLGSTYPESVTVSSFAYESTPGLAITIPSSVPEPASLGVLAIGSLALGLRRRRR